MHSTDIQVTTPATSNNGIDKTMQEATQLDMQGDVPGHAQPPLHRLHAGIPACTVAPVAHIAGIHATLRCGNRIQAETELIMMPHSHPHTLDIGTQLAETLS